MAIYAADIQINVKNKGELRTLESRFKKIETAAVSLNKTLKGLGRRNAIKVDTRAAMSAISALESRIRGLNRSVNIDARTRESRSGGGVSGGAGLPLAAAAFSGGMGRRGMDSFERISKKQMDYVDQRIAQIEQKFDTRTSQLSPVAAKMESLKKRRKVLGDDARAIVKAESTLKAQDAYRQLLKDIELNKAEFKDLTDNPAKMPRNRFEQRGLTGQVRREWKADLEKVKREGDLLKSKVPGAYEAAAKPARQIEDKLGKINELAREQASLRKVVEGEKQVTESRVKGNAVRKKVRTLEDKIEQSQVNVARTQARGLKLKEQLAEAVNKQVAAQKDFNTKQKQFNTRQAKQKNAVELEKQLATATQNRAKAQRELTKWESAQQKQIDRYGPDNIRRNYGRPGGAIDKSTRALAEADRKVAEINAKLQKTGKAADWSRSLAKSTDALSKAKAETAGLNKLLNTTNKHLLEGNKIVAKRKGLQGFQGAMGAAGRGAAASAALIPGIAPMAVGGFAGYSQGGGMKGAAIGATIAGLVQGTVALIEFSRASAQVAADMERLKTALSGVVDDQEDYEFGLKTVKTLSEKYAISQRVVLKGFTGIQASADAAGRSINDSADLMEGMIAVTLAKGKGLEELKGIMLAYQQVLSKGKPQAEELRGQISERVPGFMAGLAASMKKEMSELDKMMEKGEVTIDHFIEYSKKLKTENSKLAQEMAQSMAFAGQRLTTAVENLQSSWGRVSMIIGSGLQDDMTWTIKQLDKLADAVERFIIADRKFALKSGRENDLYRAYLKIRLGKDWEKKIQEQIDVLEGNKVIKGKPTKEQQAAMKQEDANWRKLKERLELDLKYQKDRIRLGEEEAELQRKIGEIKLQFSDRKDITEIEALLKAIEKATKAADEAKTVMDKWLDDLEERLKTLKDPMYQLTTLVDAAGDSFKDSFKDVIKGTKSVGDAFVDMFNRIADAYLDMVAEMIANQAAQGIAQFISSIISPSIGTQVGNMAGEFVPTPTVNYFATGGFVDRPTNALIGEASGEYVIPEHKMSESMSRYQAGVRGKAVIPGSSAAESGGVSGTEIVVSYTGPTLNFNGDDYVPRSAVPEIINSAAKRGAKAGEAKVFNNLKNSRSHRARIGL